MQSHTDDTEEALKQRDEALDEMEATKTKLAQIMEKWRKERETNQQLSSENEKLKNTINQLREKQTRHENTIAMLLIDQQTNKQPNLQKTTQNKKYSINFIADSNRSRITPSLRELLPNYNIHEEEGIFHTTDLKDNLKKTKPDEYDLTIIQMGTNDVRVGKGQQAIINMKHISKTLRQDKTLAVHIPPLEIGQEGQNIYQRTQAESAGLN